MKVSVCVCTYHRPVELGCLIRCFQRQDYPADRRAMVILDDAGQYDNREGDGWRLVSTATRYPTLGEKRNAAAALADPNSDVLCQWDDDDLYLPWALSASVAALQNAQWSRPSVVLRWSPEGLVQHRTWNRPDGRDKAYQGGWALRSEALRCVGGYPAASTNEDLLLARRLQGAKIRQADPIALGARPFYVWGPHGNAHLSGWPVATGYKTWAEWKVQRAAITPADPPQVDLANPLILPQVHARTFGGDWS